MNDQRDHKQGQECSRDLSPRHLYRINLRPSFWPSAVRKDAHGNPAGIIAVKKSTKGSNKRNRLSAREMNVTLGQLTRRSLPSTFSSGCPSFQHYSHATAPPQPVPDMLSESTPQMATASCTLGKRAPEDENRATPPPHKKRLRLSLNKERSCTPHSSGCTSPCGSVTSNSSSQLPTSCSSTPPLSPNSTTSAESSLSLSNGRTISRRKRYTPVKRVRTPDSVISNHDFDAMAGGVVHSTSQPCTSDTTPPLEQTTPPCIEFTSPVDDTTQKIQSPQHSEGALPKRSKQPFNNFHDISLWGGGRLTYRCDLSNCRQFDKFSQGHLENYAELVSKEGDIENYLYTVERLVNQGFFFPTSKLSEVFHVMWKCRSDYAIKKLHFCLQQDISLRSDTSMKSSHFWPKLRKCLNALASNTRVLVASVQLSYLLSFLIKNLEANRHDLRSSLVEQLLSSKNMSNVSAIIDAIFSLHTSHVDSDASLPIPAPMDCLLVMVCLPLLTCNPSTLLELRTKLAREFAMKLDGLNSHAAQYQLISAIPSNYLREKVLDFVLERNFTLCVQSDAVAQAFTDNVVSFAKITKLHLHRLPRHPNGSPQNLSFLLQLLTALIHTHLMTMTGSQPLVSLLPSSPSLSDQFMVNSSSRSSSQLMDESKVREELLEMHSSVLRFTDRLSQDNQYFIELTEPTTWFQLQLLSLITSTL